MSHHETAATLFEKLYGIKELGPGRKPIALDRARGTLEPWTAHGDPHIRETAGEALTHFEGWFSARKWNRSKDAGHSAQYALVESIDKLCNAVESLAPHPIKE